MGSWIPKPAASTQPPPPIQQVERRGPAVPLKKVRSTEEVLPRLLHFSHSLFVGAPPVLVRSPTKRQAKGSLGDDEADAFTAGSQPFLTSSLNVIMSDDTARAELIRALENQLPVSEIRPIVERSPHVLQRPDNDDDYSTWRRPVIVALQNGASLEVITCLVEPRPEALLEPGRRHDKYPLHHALMQRYDVDTIRYFVHKEPRTLHESRGDTCDLPIHTAVLCGASLPVIRALVEPDPKTLQEENIESETPLTLALTRTHCGGGIGGDDDAASSRVEVIRYLLDQSRHWLGADDELLHKAATAGAPPDVIALLLSYFPESLRQRRKKDEYLPVHCLATSNTAAGFASFRLLVDAWPESLRKREPELALHIALGSERQPPPPTGRGLDLVPLEDRVRYMLGKDPETIRMKRFDEYTALHLALIRGAPDNVLEVLLDAWPEAIHEYSTHEKASCDCCGNDGESILHVLAKTEYRTVSKLRLLVERDESIVDARSRYDFSVPLHAFASRLDDTYDDDLDLGESLDFVRYLVELRPASMLARDDDKRTPVHCAVLSPREYAPVVEYLAQQSPESLLLKDREGRLPVHLAAASTDAAYNDWRENLEVLVEQCPESLRVGDNDGNLAIHLVVTSGWGPDEVRFLAEADPDTLLERNNEGRTPLHLLIHLYPSHLVSDDTAFATFHIERKHEVARIFIETRSDVLEVGDHEGLLPLHLAASRGDGWIHLLRILVEARPDTCTIPALDGRLALHYAASCAESSLEVAQSLLEDHPEAAMVATTDPQRQLPVHSALAAANDRTIAWLLPLVELLVEAAPESLHVRDGNGQIPLQVAASNPSMPLDVLWYLMTECPTSVSALRGRQLVR